MRVTENTKRRCQVQNSQETCELGKLVILLAISVDMPCLEFTADRGARDISMVAVGL